MTEQEKYNKALEFYNTLPHTRWNKKKLQQHLNEELENNFKLEKVSEEGLISDYAFIYPINNDWGYIDIYYLLVPFAEDSHNIYITEINVSEE